MRPTNRRFSLVMLGMAAACGAASPTVWAHGLLRSVGQVAIESDHVVVSLEISPEDFTHLFSLQPAADGTVSVETLQKAARAQAIELSTTLKLWNETGETLVGEPFQWDFVGPTPSKVLWKQLRMMRVHYTTSYRIPNGSSLLTFRMSPEASRPTVAHQWILEVRGLAATSSRTMQLTSRGNAETVELAWSDGAAQPRENSTALHEEPACAPPTHQNGIRIREILVDFERRPESIDVRITVPLPLLETWNPIHRRGEGRFEYDEQAELMKWARSRMRDVLDIHVDGRVLSSESREFRILGAIPLSDDQRQTPPVGYFVSQLEIKERFAWTAPAERLTLTWKLMNNAVHAARVAFHAGETCAAGEFSSYAPTLEWNLDNAAALRGR